MKLPDYCVEQALGNKAEPQRSCLIGRSSKEGEGNMGNCLTLLEFSIINMVSQQAIVINVIIIF